MNGNDLSHPVKYLHDEDFFCLGGLTKREWFAARAMQGILADSNATGEFKKVSRLAVFHADALIDELSKNPIAEGSNLLPMHSREIDKGLSND